MRARRLARLWREGRKDREGQKDREGCAAANAGSQGGRGPHATCLADQPPTLGAYFLYHCGPFNMSRAMGARQDAQNAIGRSSAGCRSSSTAEPLQMRRLSHARAIRLVSMQACTSCLVSVCCLRGRARGRRGD